MVIGIAMATPKSSEAGPSDVAVGARAVVAVGQRKLYATVRFVGDTEFSPGTWVGLELDTLEGKNDGTVQGVRYFDCPPQKGLFIRPSMVKIVDDSMPEPTAKGGDRRLKKASSRIVPQATETPPAEPVPVQAPRPDLPRPETLGTGSAQPVAAALPEEEEEPRQALVQEMQALPKKKLTRRESVFGNLKEAICVEEGQQAMFEAVGNCASEVEKLAVAVSRLDEALHGNLARESACQGGTDQPPSTRPADREEWLGSAAGRIAQRLEEQLRQSLEEQLREAVARPLEELQTLAGELEQSPRAAKET